MSTLRGSWTPAGRVLLAALLLLGLLRLAHVVLHEPLAGFANQFDMLRITGCLGLVPDLPVAEGQATPSAPAAIYRSDAPFNPSCLPGSELLFAGLAVGVDRIADAIGMGMPGEFPLRLHALLKAALIVLAWLWLQRGLRTSPKLAIAHAATVVLLLLDPFNTLYLAGFYTESSALIGAWLALALPLTWLARGRVPGWPDGVAFALALAFLLGSRMQHVLVPLLWLGWMALWAGRQRWSRVPLLVPAVVLLPLLLGQILAGAGQPAIRAANTHNALFGAVLPAASDPLAISQRLGLPQHCAELVHTTWYLRRGRDAEAECPQAFADTSRPQWVLALLAEPESVARLVGRGIALSGQWRPAYLGELAGHEFARMPAGQIGLGLSLADGVARLPWWGLWWLWTLPALLLIPAFPGRGDGAGGAALAWLAPPLVIAVIAGWGVSLIGDGYSELARHLHLSANAAVLAYGSLAAALLRQARPAVGTAILLGVVLLGILGAWVSRTAIAYGVADEPRDEAQLAAGAMISGWALDPRGISAVRVRTADGSTVELELTPYPVLTGVFGAGVGGMGLRFEGVLPPGNARGFDIVVEPRHGEHTVIDRRFAR